MEKTGILSLTKLKDKESNLFIDYMHNSKKACYLDFIQVLFGNDYLKFVDMFSGETIKVPTRDETIKIINYIKIFVYCKERGFTEQSYESASKVFGRRKNSIKRIVEKVQNVLNSSEEDKE